MTTAIFHKQTYLIARPINGVSINGHEYLLDNSGDPIEFNSIQTAKNFAFKHGFTNSDFENGAILIVDSKK